MDVGAGHALADLIDAVERANGWSDEDVARTARARGHRLTKQNISRVRNEPVTTLVPKLLRALAEGLQLPTRQVVNAALRSADLSAGESGITVDEAIRSDPDLSGHDRRVLLAALTAMREPDGTPTMNPEEAEQRQRMRAVLTAEEARQNGGADAETATPEPPAKPPRKGRR